jgi:hypothetical protein
MLNISGSYSFRVLRTNLITFGLTGSFEEATALYVRLNEFIVRATSINQICRDNTASTVLAVQKALSCLVLLAVPAVCSRLSSSVRMPRIKGG